MPLCKRLNLADRARTELKCLSVNTSIHPIELDRELKFLCVNAQFTPTKLDPDYKAFV